MGCVLGLITSAAVIGTGWFVGLSIAIPVFLIVLPAVLVPTLVVTLHHDGHHGGGVTSPGAPVFDPNRDAKHLLGETADPFHPRVVIKTDGRGWADESHNITGVKLIMDSWDKQTGKARVCWDDQPTVCNDLDNFWLHCFDWTNTTIPDDAPKIMEHGVYTPNGTATVHRNLTHFVKPEKHWWLPLYRPKGKNLTDWMVTLDGEWAAPIAADCRYWDENWVQNTNSTTVIEVQDTPVQKGGQVHPKNWYPAKGTPSLVGHAVGTVAEARRSIEEQPQSLEDFFSDLPRGESVRTVNAFAARGARFLHDHLSSNASEGMFLAVHRATSGLLRAHDKTDRLWKRVIPAFKPYADGDVAIDALVNAVIDQTHEKDKAKMEAFAIHAMIDAIGKRVEDSGQATMADAKLMERVWSRIHPKKE